METYKGQVGNDVTIQCPAWDVWTSIIPNIKYLCHDPCKDILVEAETMKTAQKDRIHLSNTGLGLTVTFTNLQKEDSGTYACGVARVGIDPTTKFTLGVTDGE